MGRTRNTAIGNPQSPNNTNPQTLGSIGIKLRPVRERRSENKANVPRPRSIRVFLFSFFARNQFIIKNTPEVLFWLPTRGWKSKSKKILCLLDKIRSLPSAYLFASIDPSNKSETINRLKLAGWSTLFYGNDLLIKDRVLCPKTWEKRHGFCSICNLCFSKERKDIHFKRH